MAPARAALLRVVAATVLVVGAFSLLNPVLAVRLQAGGHDAARIGLFVTMPFAAVGLMVPLMPRIFAALGIARAYRIGLALEAMATLGYAATADYRLWCLFAFFAGIGATALWNGTEALLAHNAAPEQRGRVMGLYQTALGLVMSITPFLPGLLPLSADGLTLLAAAVLLLALALVSGASVTALRAHRDGAAPHGLPAALQRVPALAVVAFAGGVFEAGLGSITTAYGAQLGLGLATATTIAGVLGLGSAVLQLPCGWLADHVPLRRLFGLAGVLLGLASATFALAPQWPLAIWACAFGWGAVGGALYTLSMIRIAHVFAESSPVAGAAAMIVAYTLGGSVGALASGLMLDAAGAAGQAAWLSALALAVLAASRRF